MPISYPLRTAERIDGRARSELLRSLPGDIQGSDIIKSYSEEFWWCMRQHRDSIPIYLKGRADFR